MTDSSTKNKVKPLGQTAYEAYCVSVNNLSFTGIILPKWDETTDNIRKAWEVSAQAVVGAWKKRKVK